MGCKEKIIAFGKKHPKSRYMVIGVLAVVIFADNIKKHLVSISTGRRAETEKVAAETEYQEVKRIFNNIRNVEYDNEQTKQQFQSMNHVVWIPVAVICVGAVVTLGAVDNIAIPKTVSASATEKNLLDDPVIKEQEVIVSQGEKETEALSNSTSRVQVITKEEIKEVEIDNDVLPWYLMLINDEYGVPEDYESDLVSVEGKKVDQRIVESLQEMLKAARTEGMRCKICSGYRTPEKQQKLIDADVAKYKAKGYSQEEALELTYQGVAPVNHSEHQTGLAVDIVSSSHQALDAAHANTKEAIWLKEHCMEYGFIVRYMEGKEDITHRKAESWHFRYVGTEAATYIMENEITLEEYLEEYINK